MDLVTWAPPERVTAWVADATETLLARVEDLDDADPRWLGPHLPTVNPPIWEIAHVAWFAETFVLRRLHGRAPLVEQADARFDSGAVPHATRWSLDHLTPAAARDYLRHVADDIVVVVGDDRGVDSTLHYAAYAVAHHDAHAEALTYTRQTLGWPAPPGMADPSEAEARTTRTLDLPVDGGTVVLGASRSQPFVMDNEKWAHVVDVDHFSMADVPVTMAELADFVDDGGYGRPELWSPDGWSWRREAGADHPAYWRPADGGWEHRRFDRWRSVDGDAHRPALHVCWWEADAWCRWAGRRLPTEVEWERAATALPDGARRARYPWGDEDPSPDDAQLDALTTAPVGVEAHPAGDGPWGHRQLIGNVWEWTASTFGPYPHFEPDAYRDNSEPWFGTRKVLRGGSFATRGRYVRSTFRNYFTPDRRDVFAGFRTCPDDHR